ncbi:MAG: hypothetical protein N3F64_00470 [Nitrososphaeria archaeon]|nr:hypothetical protein [Nitrososphaeria archaeon]
MSHKSIDVRKFSTAIVFSSLYVVLSFMPIGTTLVGGTGVFSLSLILPPTVGWFLGPFYGSFSMFIGSTIYLFFNPGSFFGIFTPLVPLSGALFAGLNRRKLSFLSFSFIFLFVIFFIISYNKIWWFIIPHVLAAFSSLLYYLVGKNFKIFFSSFSSTFVQHSTGTLFAILLYHLTDKQLLIVFPQMLYERSIAAFGSFLLIMVLEKYVGHKLHF